MKNSIKSYWLRLAVAVTTVTSLSALGLADEKDQSSRERLHEREASGNDFQNRSRRGRI